jgi:cation:H+ antiporter
VLVLARFGEVRGDPEVAELTAEGVATGRESVRAVLGLAGTLAGAQLVVLGATGIAARIGLDEGLVGLTIVAIGTSLPELATAIQAARRGEAGLLVGNLLGSNLFNATAVGAVVIWVGAGLGLRVEPALAGPATLVMVGAAVGTSALLVLRRRIGRVEGLVLLAAYAVALPFIAR